MYSLIIEAARTAAFAHGGQKRYDGEPYINHPMRVAGAVTLVGDADEEMIAAAWLHDVVEDTDLGLGSLEQHFGERVGDLVDHLTNMYTKEKFPDLSRAERKAAEAYRISDCRNRSVHTIKLADRYDNISKMLKAGRGKKWAKRYIQETWELVEALEYGDKQLRELVIAKARRIGDKLK